MQTKYVRLKSYCSWKIYGTIITDIANLKRDKILLYDKLRNNGSPDKVAL